MKTIEPNPEGLPRPLPIADTRQCDVVMYNDWKEMLVEVDGYVVGCSFDEFSQGTSRSWDMFVAKHPRFQEVEGMLNWQALFEFAEWPAEDEIAYSDDDTCVFIPMKRIKDGDIEVIVFVHHRKDNRKWDREGADAPLPMFAC